MSWRQNNGKMAERDRSHVIAVLQNLKSDLINNMEHMCISGTEPSSVILS